MKQPLLLSSLSISNGRYSGLLPILARPRTTVHNKQITNRALYEMLSSFHRREPDSLIVRKRMARVITRTSLVRTGPVSISISVFPKTHPLSNAQNRTLFNFHFQARYIALSRKFNKLKTRMFHNRQPLSNGPSPPGANPWVRIDTLLSVAFGNGA